ncbi:MAG: hypothetical protein AB8C02_01125 [Halioglobus sp.]
MKIPEKLFVVINKIVRVILKSPLHGIMSGSFMLMNYRGRKSGKAFSTPVRYMRTDNGVRVYTAEHTQWWKNMLSGTEVSLIIAGTTETFRPSVYDRDPANNRELLIEFLTLYPQDAAYQDIRLNKDGSLNEADLDAAAQKSIVVEFFRL